MPTKRRRIAVGLLSLIAGGAVGYLAWSTMQHEFRGTLVCQVDVVGNPEDPPPLACLATPSGTCELEIPRFMQDRPFLRGLTEMNGKQVVVRGKWGYRRTLSNRYRAICVDELRLAVAAK